MPASTRFAVAVHILTGLAIHENEPLPSEIIAKSANTNASVIRRIMSMLNTAGFSRSQLGQGGGALLARPASSITLLDVFRAVETAPLFTLHHAVPDSGCAVGEYIAPVLQEKINSAVAALEAELNGVTIADIACRISECERGCPELDKYHGRV
ncbi:Rrf2 family transcriptional regulator [Pseudomonas benzenivorans]|jgi:Rrf2 family protein|uniref:Rrf2 family transcriptional regulator n=1 Tax=Pseudomonas benzenivorans TaxID=556533 RepID=A0ABY5H5P6_9PSED|nr:Rrf2 family transcriptional regulator [Pseudomonas benzenivorans]UTW06381.1 Rrf2 family transcriptional regulator [Pseudomonas benzenivorans]